MSELLEQAAGLAPHQRTVDSMLRMLADRLHASVVLMDSSRRVLNEAAWPRSFNNAIKEQLTAAEFPAPGAWGYCEAVDVHIYRDGIQTRDRHAMDLLIFKEGDALDVVLTRQAVEVVQLTVSIWSAKHDRIVIGELVRAILQDEPMKMRRLADIFTSTSLPSTRCGSSAAMRRRIKSGWRTSSRRFCAIRRRIPLPPLPISTMEKWCCL